jgi:putative CocE/NonD family hydrolase
MKGLFVLYLMISLISLPEVRAQQSTAEVKAHNAASGNKATSFIITDAMIPMEDGTRLHARIWKPENAEPAPAIFTLTPYTGDDVHQQGSYFAKHGYTYVSVDTRARGDSEGTFSPLNNEGKDGAQIVRWIANQTWCDGRVAMEGLSYRGMVQWQTLAEHPPALKTIVPTASVYPGWDFPNPNGIFSSYAARWLGFTQGAALQLNLFSDSKYWNGKYMQMYQSHLSFAALDSLTGIPSRFFEMWVRHPSYDEFWKQMNPKPSDYAKIDLPVLTITGHFDSDQPGALKYYSDHMQHGSASGKEQHYLLIGPWGHTGTLHPRKEHRGLTFGKNSVLNMKKLHLSWYNRVFRDGKMPKQLRDRVTYYVMGANRWKHAPSLDSVASDTMKWYLSSPNSRAKDVFHSGRLEPRAPSEADIDQMVYDPLNTPVEGEDLSKRTSYTGGGLAFREGWKKGDQLVYHSPPIGEDTEISGRMQLDAYIELNVPDTDLLAAIYEVRPDGKTIYLGECPLRARYRQGVEEPDLVTPGKVHHYKFERFYWFSRQIQSGSRIRLVISPLNSPKRDKNYNSGGNTINEKDQDARTATIKLHMSSKHPSALSLPVAND